MLRTSTLVRIAGLIVVTLLFAVFTAQVAESGGSGKQDVPEKTLTALNKAYPNAQILTIEKEETKGQILYEFEIKEGEDEKDLIYLEDGSLYAIEEVISVNDLPSKVMNALKKAYPEGELDQAEKITRQSETEYEVVLEVEETDEEMEYEIVITSNGKVTSTEQIRDEDQGDEDDE
jgi:hypothetical protein